jgi:arginine/lysine/ornithine decarboxylase
VILARGCHRSVYHALEIGRLKPIYLSSPVNPTYGFFDSVSPQEVEKTMEEHPEGKWVVLTSPTYEGVISDIQSIAEIVHKRGGLLLVDQAHGAHLGLSPAFPADALSCGADVVVSSLHKTLPALTQTAALHLRVGLDPIPFEHALSVFETSSPSYLLLASIDRCVTLLEQKREELFESYRQALCRFDREVAGLQKVQIPGHNAPLSEGIFDWDPGKLTVCTPDAQVVCEKLRRAFWIEPEMVTPDWVLCMTSIADGEKELHRLAHALFQIEHQLFTQEVRHFETPPLPIQRLSPSEAMRGENQLVPWDQAVGRVAGEYVQAYPPGIPLVVPGEQITEDLCRQITYQREHLTCLEHSISQVSGQILVKAENQH